MSGGRQIRVVVVDDSALMRAMLRRAIEGADDLVCVGQASDAAEGREMIRTLNPDVVTLDVEMPGMNGLEFLHKIMTLRPTPVIMVSTLTQSGTETSLAALEAGAVDVVAKPSGADAPAFAERLRATVRVAAGARVTRRKPAAPVAAVAKPKAPPPISARFETSLIAIGASTGGVQALGALFEVLPYPMPPIVIAQHMPPGYTGRFAMRLNNSLRYDVAEARDGERLGPGMIRIAPGDRHLVIKRTGQGLESFLDDAPPVTGHKPSVDMLFRSVAALPQDVVRRTLGLILTGMGRDGAEGLAMMRKAGSFNLGESAKSCTVYGMPRAAAEVGAVHEELELKALAARLPELVQTRNPAQSTPAARRNAANI
ncbi:MAG: chemotaxis response regulator protein-glutamate methylesterase [Pseudomonadota bacterium]